MRSPFPLPLLASPPLFLRARSRNTKQAIGSNLTLLFCYSFRSRSCVVFTLDRDAATGRESFRSRGKFYEKSFLEGKVVECSPLRIFYGVCLRYWFVDEIILKILARGLERYIEFDISSGPDNFMVQTFLKFGKISFWIDDISFLFNYGEEIG